jgi:hypothetical protein
VVEEERADLVKKEPSPVTKLQLVDAVHIILEIYRFMVQQNFHKWANIQQHLILNLAELVELKPHL